MREVPLLSDLFAGSANAQADIDSVAYLLERLMSEREAHEPDQCPDCIEQGPEPYPCAGCSGDVRDPESIYCPACIVLNCEEEEDPE